jgi:hypothetical protein
MIGITHAGGYTDNRKLSEMPWLGFCFMTGKGKKILHWRKGKERQMSELPDIIVKGLWKETHTFYEFNGCYWNGLMRAGRLGTYQPHSGQNLGREIREHHVSIETHSTNWILGQGAVGVWGRSSRSFEFGRTLVCKEESWPARRAQRGHASILLDIGRWRKFIM